MHYLNLFDALAEEGSTASLPPSVAWPARATHLLVVDGAAVIEDVAPSQLALRRFVQQLQAAILGATTVLLTSHTRDQLEVLGAHVDGVLVLANERFDSRHVRQLEVLKLRGGRHVTGAHEFLITDDGLTVHPRLESVVGWRRPPEQPSGLLGTGVPGLDAMLGGGLTFFSSTLLMGTPGAGKTLLGLSFPGGRPPRRTWSARGVPRDRAGPDVDGSADRTRSARRHRVRAHPHHVGPTPRALRRCLGMAAARRGGRASTTAGLHRCAHRHPALRRLPAADANLHRGLTNELRALGATALIATEIDAYVDEQLAVPIPAASATMDNGLLVRQVEIRSSLAPPGLDPQGASDRD